MALLIYETIYQKLERILGDLTDLPEYAKFKAPGFMDLNLDRLYADEESVTIALSHYYKQNGDMVPDPDMEIRIYPAMKMAEALTYQDCFGYREVYPAPGKMNPKAKKELNIFLNQWLSNIAVQGFEKAEGDTDEL